MSALGAVLGKRTWLGAGAILLAAAGGCALGALLVVKGVLPEGWWPSGAGERGH